MPAAFERDGVWLKQCTRCDEVKSIDEYYRQAKRADGKSPHCKVCASVDQKMRVARAEQDPEYVEHRNMKRRMAYKDNPDRQRAYNKRPEARARKNALRRERRKTDPIWAAKERERSRLSGLKPEIRRRHCQRQLEREKEDLGFKIRRRLRSSLSTKLSGSNKSGSTIDLIGCSIVEYQRYIEAQWIDGMSWDNYGKGPDQWSYDHVVPCALFDLTQASHQRAAFHYTNVRPMWHTANIRKQDILEDGRSARYLTVDEKRQYLTEHGFGRLFTAELAYVQYRPENNL